MNRRRRFWVVVALAAGAALLVFGRPGADADTESGDPERPAVREEPGPGVPERPTGQASSQPRPAVEPEPPHEPSGVVGDERLDPDARAGAVRAAEQFAEIWATPDPQWYERLAELATPELAANLAGAEPPPDPGYRITGDPEVQLDAPQWARVGVPTDGGTVVLDVAVVEGEWLVSAVDWWPA